jgi:hypothetical protein
MPSDPFLSPMGGTAQLFQADPLALFYPAATSNLALNPFLPVLEITGESGLLPQTVSTKGNYSIGAPTVPHIDQSLNTSHPAGHKHVLSPDPEHSLIKQQKHLHHSSHMTDQSQGPVGATGREPTHQKSAIQQAFQVICMGGRAKVTHQTPCNGQDFLFLFFSLASYMYLDCPFPLSQPLPTLPNIVFSLPLLPRLGLCFMPPSDLCTGGYIL